MRRGIKRRHLRARDLPDASFWHACTGDREPSSLPPGFKAMATQPTQPDTINPGAPPEMPLSPARRKRRSTSRPASSRRTRTTTIRTPASQTSRAPPDRPAGSVPPSAIAFAERITSPPLGPFAEIPALRRRCTSVPPPLSFRAPRPAQIKDLPPTARRCMFASAATAPAVVLIHGYGETDMWAPLAADLAKDHKVINAGPARHGPLPAACRWI